MLDNRGKDLSQSGNTDMNNTDIDKTGQSTNENHLIRVKTSFPSKETAIDIPFEGNVLKGISTESMPELQLRVPKGFKVSFSYITVSEVKTLEGERCSFENPKFLQVINIQTTILAHKHVCKI